MTNKTAKDKPASQMLTVEQMEQVIAEQGKRIFELENATQPSLPSAIQALAPAAAEGEREAVLNAQQGEIARLNAIIESQQRMIRLLNERLESTQPPTDGKPRDCSGDPTSCPDNEGCGCYCSDNKIASQPAAPIQQASVASGAVTEKDVETLIDLAQRLKEIQHWVAQVGSRELAKVAQKLLPLAAAPTEPPKDEPEAFRKWLTENASGFTSDEIEGMAKCLVGYMQDRASLAAAPTEPPKDERAEFSDEQIASLNPYHGSGLPAENWRRGFLGEKLIAMKGSAAEQFYKEGKAARASLAAAQQQEPDEDTVRAAVEYVTETQGFDVQDERDAELVESVAIAVVRHLAASHPHHLTLIREGDIPQAAQPQECIKQFNAPCICGKATLCNGRGHAAAQPQEAGQAQELPPLTRHSPVVAQIGYDHVAEMPESADGEWVRFADVESLVQTAPAVPEGWKHTITRAAECLEILNKRPRPMCRDCADENGICPNGGLDCDMRKLIADVRAIAAVPSAPADQGEKKTQARHCGGCKHQETAPDGACQTCFSDESPCKTKLLNWEAKAAPEEKGGE